MSLVFKGWEVYSPSQLVSWIHTFSHLLGKDAVRAYMWCGEKEKETVATSFVVIFTLKIKPGSHCQHHGDRSPWIPFPKA